MIKIDSDCYGTILLVWAIVLLLGFVVIRFTSVAAVRIPLLVLLGVFGCFVTWFHRVPERETPAGDAGTVTAVADGKILQILPAYEGEYLKRDCMLVSIYMNFFDVHANFWPMDGTVSYYKYHPGKYLLAFHPKASEKNEHSSTVIRSEKGELLFKQIAGTFARRIVIYSKEGESVRRGAQCGIIKFGSRIDMYLPLDAEIKVKVGDLTRACETVIAQLK